MQYLEVDTGEVICYRKYESIIDPQQAKTIVFIHPNFLSQRSWDPILSYMREFNLYTLDMRGFGKSTYKTHMKSISDFSNDIISFCNKLNLTKVNLIGWSLGGGVSMDLTLLAPQIVESIILIGSISVKGFQILNKEGRERNEEQIRQKLNPIGEKIEAKNRQFMFENIIDGQLLPRKNVVGEQILEEIYEQMESQRNLVDSTTYLAMWDISEEAKNIQCPILIYHGTKDITVSIDEAIINYECFKQHNPKTFLCKLEGGTHAPVYEVPQQMAQLFSDFIKNHYTSQTIAHL